MASSEYCSLYLRHYQHPGEAGTTGWACSFSIGLTFYFLGLHVLRWMTSARTSLSLWESPLCLSANEHHGQSWLVCLAAQGYRHCFESNNLQGNSIGHCCLQSKKIVGICCSSRKGYSIVREPKLRKSQQQHYCYCSDHKISWRSCTRASSSSGLSCNLVHQLQVRRLFNEA